MDERPDGIKVIVILIIIEIFMTLISLVEDIQINLFIFLLDLVAIGLGILAVYSLWNLKIWGWMVAIVYVVYDMGISALLIFVFVDVADEYAKSVGMNIDAYRSSLQLMFMIYLVIAIIVIAYVYSKRNLFQSRLDLHVKSKTGINT